MHPAFPAKYIHWFLVCFVGRGPQCVLFSLFSPRVAGLNRGWPSLNENK
jgi:hypothetical protein